MVQPILDSFRQQAESCRRLGSPFTAALLSRAADEPAVQALVGDWPGDPVADALPLRFAGALHAGVLTEPASPLASHYPPRGDQGDDPALWTAILDLLEHDRPAIVRFLAGPPQTNEVRRSAMLLGGFLEIARSTGLPLRLVEIGASAGLNQLWDHYHYRLGEIATWGPAHSDVKIATDWTGPPPAIEAPLRVASRTACDAAPLDLEDPAARLRLRCYVWADQIERLALLDAAIAAARAAGTKVIHEDAGDFVARQFRQLIPGLVSVLYHSVMWQYLPAATQQRISATMEAAGAAATAEAPVAWLRMEFKTGGIFPLQLTLWPGGSTVTLATCHPHGAAITWGG